MEGVCRDDEIYGTNSPNTGITETEKDEEEGFEIVERENNDDPHLTGCNACESFKRKWDYEKAKLEMLLQAEEKKVMDIGDTLRMRTEEIEKNEAELLKYNAEKENWEKETAHLLRSLEAEKQKVKSVEIFWENEIKEIKEKAEKELLKYNAEKENWEKETAELHRSLEAEKQKVKKVEIFWANKIREIKENAEKEIDQLKNKNIYCNGLIQQHTNEKELLLHTVENLKLEKDNLQTRLSSIASDRMTHENVNITDLSDANRPTKLQEVYSELYDNGWTDAFEELTDKGFPDKDVIMILLDILMISFQKCREITWGRYEKLRYVASSVEILQRKPISVADKNVATENVDSGDPNVSAALKDKFEDENEKGFQCTIDLCIDLEKKIKDIWRKTTVELKENVIEQLYSVIETCQNIALNGCPMTSKYLKSCVNLCWKMGVQERPMHLDTVSKLDDDHGKKFDTNKFRAYTRSGNNVAFVVWPALFLNEGGPMLAKGIAQGCSNDEEQNTGVHF